LKLVELKICVETGGTEKDLFFGVFSSSKKAVFVGYSQFLDLFAPPTAR